MPVHSRSYNLYMPTAEGGHRHWSIYARPTDDYSSFQVKMVGGDVLQIDPEFMADDSDAECSLFPTEAEANAAADEEFRTRLAQGWIHYTGGPFP